MPPENVITCLSRRSAQVDHLEHLVHPGRRRRRVDAVQLGVHAQVLRGGEVDVQRGVLEDQADVAAHVVALRDDVEAADARRAGRRLGQRAEHVDRRALAGAVGAEEAEDLARRDGERNAADGVDVAVGLDEVVDLDGGWRWEVTTRQNNATVTEFLLSL